jgi:hypothetical protein
MKPHKTGLVCRWEVASDRYGDTALPLSGDVKMIHK